MLPKFGSPLAIKNAPTKFGTVSLLLEKVGDQYKLEIDSKFHKNPISITVCFPKKVKMVSHKGKEFSNNTASFDVPQNEPFTSLFFTPDNTDDLNNSNK